MTIKRTITKDIFLSYASADQNAATKIYDAIVEAGGRAFFSGKGQIAPGVNFAEQIREELQGSKALWLLVTPNSIKSEWVLTEWGAAWALDMKIVPILLRCPPETLPDRLSQLQYIDYHEYPKLVADTFLDSTRNAASDAEDRRLIDELLDRDLIIPAVSIGQRHLFAGRFAESLALFEYARDTADKNHYNYYIILGNIAYSLINLGRNREALHYLARVRAYHNGETFFAWHAFAAAAVHLREGEIEECRQMVAYAKTRKEYAEEVERAKLNYPDLLPFIDEENKETHGAT